MSSHPIPLQPLRRGSEQTAQSGVVGDPFTTPLPTPIAGGAQPQRKSRWGWHPLSLIVIWGWVVYIAINIVLFELAVRTQDSGIDTVANLFHTWFSQFHGMVTTLYLVRVCASAFKEKRAAQCTWGELFWLTDQTWTSPLRLVPPLKTIIKTGVSSMFFAFAFTSTVAFFMPSIFSRAYPLRSVSFPSTSPTFSTQRILDVDRDTQISTGLGSWVTGRSVFDTYEFNAYTLDVLSQGNLSDFFFSDDIGEDDRRLPGLRLHGGCASFSDDASTAVEQNTTLFPTFCDNSLPSQQDRRVNMHVSFGTANVTFSYCTFPSALTVPSGADSNATAYIFIQSNNGTANTTGIVKCQSNFSLGSADLFGPDMTYSSFGKDLPYNPVQGAGIADPLSAVLAGIANTSVVNDTFESRSSLIKQLGYNGTLGNGNSLAFTQPSLDIFADRIWLGVAHMTAGIGTLSSIPNAATSVVFIRLRSRPFLIGFIALFASWLCGLIYVSIRGFRRCTEPALTSHTIAVHVQAVYTPSHGGNGPLNQLDFSNDMWRTKIVGQSRS
ncbi:hypothetical protein BU17DRAFT_84365 [Hysterangium stoloniferum]|nr:hypothetical protein BU17DRAFT_84365 [Hysterangium stoloniferum]